MTNNIESVTRRFDGIRIKLKFGGKLPITLSEHEADYLRQELIKISQTKFMIYDHKAKTYLFKTAAEPLSFPDRDHAELYKDDLLDRGEYPDSPHIVFSIHEFRNNHFVQDVT